SISWGRRVVFASEANWITRQASSAASPRRSRHASFNSGRSLVSKSKRVTLGEVTCHRDGGTRGQGDKQTSRQDVFLLVHLSPCLLVSLSSSHSLFLSVSPWLVR